MAGHSKFKNIMHRKGAQDAKRAKVFAKLAREITVAAKMGAPEPDKNPRLRAAIQAARAQNMPKDRIDRAMTPADTDGANFEEVRYEGIGPGGTAVICEALTDNRNRTASDVRAAFSKNGGTLGETNSVSFNFQRVGLIQFPASVGDHDTVLEAAIEAGAQDVESGDEVHLIYSEPDDFNEVRDALEKTLGEPEEAHLDWRPLNTIDLDEDKARVMFKLIDALEDNDDVQRVSANYDVSDEIMERLEG